VRYVSRRSWALLTSSTSDDGLIGSPSSFERVAHRDRESGVLSNESRLRAELGPEQLQLPPIRLDRALAHLAGQVTVSRLRQRDAGAFRFLRLDLQECFGQLGLPPRLWSTRFCTDGSASR
jgi:hypothetical protein